MVLESKGDGVHYFIFFRCWYCNGWPELKGSASHPDSQAMVTNTPHSSGLGSGWLGPSRGWDNKLISRFFSFISNNLFFFPNTSSWFVAIYGSQWCLLSLPRAVAQVRALRWPRLGREGTKHFLLDPDFGRQIFTLFVKCQSEYKVDIMLVPTKRLHRFWDSVDQKI